MERRKLSVAEIENKLENLAGWEVTENKLLRKYKFKNFAESLEFVNKTGEIAENFDHHPDITFGWGYAEIYLTTHDAGGITEKDFAVAAEINNL